MGQECGVCGVFGLLLSEYPELDETLAKMEVDRGLIESISMEEPVTGADPAVIAELNKAYPNLEGSCNDSDIECVMDARWLPTLKAIFLERMGITVPYGACLTRTAGSEESPGRQETPIDAWVLGFGILTLPRDWPAMPDSFYMAAKFHTWVWAG